MSRSLNKVMLIGNVGNDPEVRSSTLPRREPGMVPVATSRKKPSGTGACCGTVARPVEAWPMSSSAT